MRLVGLLATVLIALAPRTLLAQAAWEFSPYDVKVCAVFTDEPEFTPAFAANVREELAHRADVVFFAAWKLATVAPNSAVTGQMLARWDKLSFDSLKTADANLVQGDKLYLISVAREGSEYLVRGR